MTRSRSRTMTSKKYKKKCEYDFEKISNCIKKNCKDLKSGSKIVCDMKCYDNNCYETFFNYTNNNNLIYIILFVSIIFMFYYNRK